MTKQEKIGSPEIKKQPFNNKIEPKKFDKKTFKKQYLLYQWINYVLKIPVK